MTEKSLVSVYINAYNAEKYILKTINSVINQTYKNLQIIVVDDCSEDSTLDLVKSVKDDRIEIYKTPFNGHMSFACNEALKHVKGDYVAHIDADDLWMPDKIEKQVKFLEENLQYGACFTHVEIIDEFDNIASEKFDPMRKVYEFGNLPHAQMYRYLYDNLNKFSHSSPLIRTKFIKLVGDYDVSTLYLQDYDYWMRLITKCPFYILPEKLNLIRQHSQNNSTLNASQLLAHNNEAFRIIYKSINMCPDSLFLEAFSDKLKFSGEHSHQEVEIEKAYLLLEGPLVAKGNRALGIAKFSELFKNEEMVELIKKRFNFTTRDFYQLQSSILFTNHQNKKNRIVVYYDCGNGYSEENKEVIEYNTLLDRGEFIFALPQNVNAVRIDPVDNEFCIINNLTVTANGRKLEYSGNYLAVDEEKKSLFFFTKDPQIWVNIESNISDIKICFNIFETRFDCNPSNDLEGMEEVIGMLGDNIISQKNIIDAQTSLISQKESIIAEKDVVIQHRDAEIASINGVINMKDNVIKEQDNIIEQQENVIKQQSVAIGEKEEIISQKQQIIEDQVLNIQNKDLLISEKDSIINDYNNRYNYLNEAYTEITNSFYWRVTAVPRKFTGRIKSMVSQKYPVMKCLVFIKGFLRGGIKEGKIRVESYKAFIKRNVANLERNTGKLYELSDENREFEENYPFENLPKISILVPLYNTPDNFLKEMIDSVTGQTYKNWELCLADGSEREYNNVGKYCRSMANKDPRIKYKKLAQNGGISENTNECLKMAAGDFIALFDHDDVLHPSVLFEYVKVINEKNADFIYCDETTFTCEGKNNYKIVLNHHKPEFSPDTLRSYNYICHFTCFARELYEMVGGFNKDFDGSQDYDLILRLTEKAKHIVRIPKLLYFWRSHSLSVASSASAKPYVVNAAEKALSAHLKRIGLKGTVRESYAPTTYKIDYEIEGNPKVSIIIPNKDHIDDLGKCVNSILSLSTYKNYEIIIVENNSEEKQTFNYYDRLESEHSNIKVVTWDKKGFNYSAINNFGADFATGEYILLLNNDIEVITKNWIEEMLMFAQRKEVGAVGAKLYYPDDTIQHAGVILGIGGVAGHSHKYFYKHEYGYMSRACISQNLSACTAACLLVRKDVFDEIDGLDEGFAVAFNDIDLCMKIRDKGYLIVFTPYAEFYHYESKSRGFEDSPEKVERFNGEINRFQDKWGEVLEKGDPYYNPNLTLIHEDFSLK